MVCRHEIVAEVVSLMRHLDEFVCEAEAQIEQDRRRIERREIRTDHVRLYVRVGLRGVPDRWHTGMALCVADISVDEAYRSQGILHVTLAMLEQRRAFDGIFVENVGEFRLRFFLERRGYVTFPPRPDSTFGAHWWRRHPPTVPLV